MMNETDEISRVTRSKQEARIAYDRISRWYDLLEGFWEKRIRESGLRKLEIREGYKVLEIGFATGDSILTMASKVGQSGKVYGVDISPRMMEITQTRVAKAGLAPRVELICQDALQLPFADDSLNGIFMSFTLELFDTPEIPLVLEECHRVLCPGGRICVVSLSKNGGREMMVKMYEWFHSHFPGVVDCRPIYARQAMKKSGFMIQEFEQTSIFGLPVEIDLACKKI